MLNHNMIGAHFVATLPEAEVLDSGAATLEIEAQLALTPCNEPQQVGSSTVGHAILKEVSTPTAEREPGKLHKVLADMCVATLPI